MWDFIKSLLSKTLDVERSDNTYFKDNKVSYATYSVNCGSHSWYCQESSCSECNPMTPKRVAEINKRFLCERGYE